MTPPTGPVFISLPGDILNAFGAIDLGRATRVDTRVRPSDEGLRALALRLLEAKRPVIIAGCLGSAAGLVMRSWWTDSAAQFGLSLSVPA